WIPFDQLPHAFDPPEHFIVTANHRPAPATYPYSISVEWIEPFRGQRITDLIRRPDKLTPDVFAAIQADTMSLQAKALLPLLLSRVHPQSESDDRAIAILRRWNADTRGDSSAAAIFEAWFHRLAAALAGHDVGPALTDLDQVRVSYETRFFRLTPPRNDRRVGHCGRDPQ